MTNRREPPHRYCGREFSAQEIEWISRLIETNPRLDRAALSRRVCEELRWIRPDERLKDMSCRVAMIRMECDGLIELPPPRTRNGNGRRRPILTSASDPRPIRSAPAGALGEISFEIVESRRTSRLWNELVERYHYLGYQPLPGAQLRYNVRAGRSLVCVVGFGAAAWAVRPRDEFIGWTREERVRNLHRVVNNARFLILPWVESANLASRILGAVSRRLPRDWQLVYGYRPVLLETFVQSGRFRGTCYRAANWIQVGRTQGRGKLDRAKAYALPIKDVLLYPLSRDFRERLKECGDDSTRTSRRSIS